MALLTNSDWRDILSVLGLLLVVLTVYLRLQELRFIYYEGSIYIHFDPHKEHKILNVGKVFRKNKKMGTWQMRSTSNGAWENVPSESLESVERQSRSGMPVSLHIYEP